MQSKVRKAYGAERILEENGLPLVVPEDIKYFVLRYAYWKGNKDDLEEYEFYEQNRTKKFVLEPLNRTETVNLFGIPLIVEIKGSKDNPQIKLIDGDTNKQIAVFSWFDENVIIGDCDIDEETVEQVLILGDFTTR